MLTLPDAMVEQRRLATKKVMATRRQLAYLVQSMLAGSFIGVAVVLMVSAAGPLLAAGSPWTPLVQGLVFGIALSLVVFAGGELATSNMMILTQGALGGSIHWARASGTLVFSFVGNLAGSLTFAVMVHQTGLLAPGTPAGEMIAWMLEKKAHETSGQLFWRGVLCNMLVCLAVWAGARMRSEAGRLIMIFWCLLAFITSGFEHVVANMTTFGLGLVGGLGTTWADLGENMLMVGLGNLVGGAIIVGAGYAIAAGRPKVAEGTTPAASALADRAQVRRPASLRDVEVA
jgi:nitrite transporter NirC